MIIIKSNPLFWASLVLIFVVGFVTAQENGTGSVLPAYEVCPNQVFAFCALAECWTYNNVAYCLCSVETKQDSVSLTQETIQGNDICSINEMGETTAAYGGGNWMMSTFYNDPKLQTPNGTHAFYNCPIGSVAAYAQCDGAVCFSGTQDNVFPYFGELEGDEIICSCAIVYNQELPFIVTGPFDHTAMDNGCDTTVFETFCNSTGTSQPRNDKGDIENGIVIRVGAPAGDANVMGNVLADYENVTSPNVFKCALNESI